MNGSRQGCSASFPDRRGPASIKDCSKQCVFALLGLGLGPIVATQLLGVVPSWRWIFWIVAIPGFIVGALLFRVLREPAETQGASLIGAGERGGSWLGVLKSRNIVVSMLALFGAMACVFVLSAMVPNYLIDYLGLTAARMGFVTSAIGFGGFFRQFGVPGLSDLFGRKLVAILGFLGAAVAVWIFARIGAAPGALFLAALRCELLLPRQRRADHGAERDGGRAGRARGLIEAAAEIAARSALAGFRGEFAAASLKLGLRKGTRGGSQGFRGETPLWAAVDARNLDVTGATRDNRMDRNAAFELIGILLERGADANARIREYPPERRFITRLGSLSWVDFTGQTPFLRAALAGDTKVMRLLLQHGADPNIATFEGTTPLMAAAGVNWVVNQTFDEGPDALLEAVKLCLELGNDVNAVNSMGLRAIHGAANRGSNAIIELLAENGAQLDVADKQGRTPVTWAEGVFLATHPPERKPETIALLERLGAHSGDDVR
jgi:MFS family permease